MLKKLKNIIRKLTPEPVIQGYHLALAEIAAKIYGNPSEKLYVVGITGTKGKTSAANFVWSVLTAAGYKVGQIGTAQIRIGQKEIANTMHMTMPGRFLLQKYLREMVDAGCTHVVMEVTSEGIKLNRHRGIIFDCAIFTNLAPEHLESHGGSFENYKNTKGKLFASLMQHTKRLDDKLIKRVSIANRDDEHSDYFASFPADVKLNYSIEHASDVRAQNIMDSDNGVNFEIENQSYHLEVLGHFNVYNALPAIALGRHLHAPEEKIRQGISDVRIIPGRMEKIEEGQSFTVLVDYAHENLSFNKVLDAARKIAGVNKVIVLTGGQGGGRDRAKRAQMGETAAKKADFVVVTNEDPYDDNPQDIIHEIADAAVAHGKVIGQTLFRNPDRRGGIAKALSLANTGDIVIIAGKGAEQTMMVKGGSIPWNEREIVREELRKFLQK
ncbi:MAG: UDP-N-acetylmuramoyl-L-alanyl-D-glutamate--2,6-diaminopimelate ligase [Candidatus Doudnabacteria bacterium]|nr:UDP-N-acetylmuramoyl-L-alanyl-D-glutamate--2,6-diaminopimelate ligase [Candidatus Doudnabacteria bacterium]